MLGLTSLSLAVARSSLALRVATRGMVGKTLRYNGYTVYEGWPRLARDGWPFARWLKKKGDYETKQAKARRKGLNKGRDAQALKALTYEEPMFVRMHSTTAAEATTLRGPQS